MNDNNLLQEEALVTDDVVESWEDIEAPAMPVPIKVKQQQRKEEKRNKAKMQQQVKKDDLSLVPRSRELFPAKEDPREGC